MLPSTRFKSLVSLFGLAAFSSDFDYPDYDVDYEDEEWINDKRQTLPDDFSDDLVLYFECIMDRLEKATTHSMNVSP